MEPAQYLALIQSAYFLITGLWPLVHMPGFLRVTGPKTDLWLVRTVGALVAAIGLTLGLAAILNEIQTSIGILGIGSAISLMLIDIVYVLKKVISRVYLLDAMLEFALATAWLVLA